MSEKEKIKRLLPKGSYMAIAKEIGKSYGTVRDYFAPSKDFSISEDVENKLLNAARKIINQQSMHGITVVHGKEKASAVKAALAA